MLALALTLSLAFTDVASAAEDECVACCRAAGLAGCRTALKMYGEGSMATPESGAWRVLGLWYLDCIGQGRFEAGVTTVVASMPVSGELLLASVPPAAFHCFTQACSFPEHACFEAMAEDRVRLVDCRDGAAMPASQLAQPGPEPPGSEAVIAVVGDRPLVVTPIDTPTGQNPAQSSRPCCGQQTSQGLFGQSTPPSTAEITTSNELSRRDIVSSPVPPHLDEARGVDASDRRYVLEVPETPLADACDVADMLRTESRRRVETGNEAVVKGEIQQAIDEYRAALTLDPCNPYAWADMGAMALELGDNSSAAIALSQAVEIQPRHYTAYTNLGLAYEGLGQPGLAAEAFRIALTLRPHHAAASQGLQRVRGGE